MSTGKDGTPEWGPAMAALPNDKWRAFVVALYDDDAPTGRARKGHIGLYNWAVAKAGFNHSNANSRHVHAHRLLQDKRIIAACNEYGKARLRVGLNPVAFQAVKDLLGDHNSKQRLRAAALVLDRTDPIPKQPLVQITNTYVPPTPQMTAEVLRRIDELAAKAGLPQLPPPIDVEATEVPPEGEA